MRNPINTLTGAALIATLGGTTVLAQGALIGTQRVDDRVRVIEERVADDIALGEDRLRFGNEQFAPGWTGSIALGANAASGNTSTRDLSMAGRFRFNHGQWSHTFAFGLEQARSGSVQTRNQAFGVYDANYYVSGDVYVFGMGRLENDRLANIQDTFIGGGLGYRVVNTENAAWRIQAGPGWRSNRTGGLHSNEMAAVAASRFFYRISDGVFVSNDTDVLQSRIAGTRVTNDLGVTFAVSPGISTRVSYATDWTNRPAPGRVRTDSRVGVAMVFALR